MGMPEIVARQVLLALSLMSVGEMEVGLRSYLRLKNLYQRALMSHS